MSVKSKPAPTIRIAKWASIADPPPPSQTTADASHMQKCSIVTPDVPVSRCRLQDDFDDGSETTNSRAQDFDFNEFVSKLHPESLSTEPVHIATSAGDTEQSLEPVIGSKKKNPPKSNAKMMREYRMRVKADPIKYKRYLEQERIRNNRRKRHKRKELNDIADELEVRNSAVSPELDIVHMKLEPQADQEAPKISHVQSLVQCKIEPKEEQAKVLMDSLVQCKTEPQEEQQVPEIAHLQSLAQCKTEITAQTSTGKVQPTAPITETPTKSTLNVQRNSTGIQICAALPEELLYRTFDTSSPAPSCSSSSSTKDLITTIADKSLCLATPATEPIESAKQYAIADLFCDLNNAATQQPLKQNHTLKRRATSPICGQSSQDIKITVVTLEEAPFRPKIAVIRTRDVVESTENHNINTTSCDTGAVANRSTNSSPDGDDVEDITPAPRLIDLTDDAVADDPSKSEVIFDATTEQMDETGSIGCRQQSPEQNGHGGDENESTPKYLDSFLGFVTQQEPETSKQRLVSKWMKSNRYS